MAIQPPVPESFGAVVRKLTGLYSPF